MDIPPDFIDKIIIPWMLRIFNSFEKNFAEAKSKIPCDIHHTGFAI